MLLQSRHLAAQASYTRSVQTNGFAECLPQTLHHGIEVVLAVCNPVRETYCALLSHLDLAALMLQQRLQVRFKG